MSGTITKLSSMNDPLIESFIIYLIKVTLLTSIFAGVIKNDHFMRRIDLNIISGKLTR